MRICMESMELATKYCPDSRSLEFMSGTQPRRFCSLHGPVQARHRTAPAPAPPGHAGQPGCRHDGAGGDHRGFGREQPARRAGQRASRTDRHHAVAVFDQGLLIFQSSAIGPLQRGTHEECPYPVARARGGCPPLILIFDLDGVIYRGDTAVPGAIPTLHRLAAAGHRLFFLTNNSTRSRRDYAEKITGMGFPARPEQVMTSAYATGLYLRHQGAEGKRVFLIGEHGLAEEMTLAGLIVVPLESDERADYVVVGLDRFLTFAKLQRAFTEVRSGAAFVATNKDPDVPDGGRQGDPRGRQHGRRARVRRRHYAGRHRQTGAVHAGGDPAPGLGPSGGGRDDR